VSVKRRVPIVFELNEDVLIGSDRRRLSARDAGAA